MAALRARGFTLVEVLVALAVLALIAGMAWRGVDGIARTRDASQARLEDTLRLQAVMGQWAADLAAVQDVAVVPALRFDGARLRLTRHAEGGMQLVVWSRVPGPAGSGRWLRWASAVTTTNGALRDAWMASQTLRDDDAGQVVALENVAQWQLYFYRGNAWSNAQSSADVVAAAAPASAASAASAAAATLRQALPTGVRSVLTLPTGTLERDVFLGP